MGGRAHKNCDKPMGMQLAPKWGSQTLSTLQSS
jgi:hypothetical protein